MKILICGDLHFRDKAPRNRKDDYFETIKRKLTWIYNLAKDIDDKDECILIFPGDVFDSYKANDLTKKTIINILDGSVHTFAVVGNHDQRYRMENYDNTPIGVLEAACSLLILKKNSIGNVDLYGVNWNGEIPKIEDKNKFNILVIHKMISDKDYWSGNLEYEPSYNFLKKNQFDLIISGDNHHCFTQQYKGRYLVNAGSVVRSSISQIDHIPCVFIFNIENKELIPLNIPIEKDVFREDAFLLKKENQDLIDFVEKLRKFTGIVPNSEINFEKNIKSFMELNCINKEISDLVYESIKGDN